MKNIKPSSMDELDPEDDLQFKFLDQGRFFKINNSH